MSVFDHEAFLHGCEVSFVGAPSIDANTAYVEVRGEVQALPPRDALVRAAEGMGFEVRAPSLRAGAALVAERGLERLEVQLHEAIAVGRMRQRARVSLVWRDRRERPIEGGAFAWQARAWPAFFEAGRVYHESRDMLMLEGRTPSDGAAACIARYRDWAQRAGLSSGPAADSLAGVESDLAGGAHFHDATHELVIEDRGPRMLLRVQRRDATGD
jgi:hypothetical protein